MKRSVLTPRLREALRPPPILTVDQWAEQNVYLPRAGGAESGRIDLDRTPYAREPLHMARDPEVDEITLCFAAQTTICQLVVLFYLAEDPWPCLHVMPREDDAVAINCDRYQAIIEESPNLRRLLTGAKHDMTREAIHLGGNTLTFVGANSPAALASRPICILILDETDKYPEFSGREADPIELAKARTVSFSNRKTLKASTPTTMRGYIWGEFLAGDRRRYHVPCPHCGTYQVLVLGDGGDGPGIKAPKDKSFDEIIAYRLAWYECVECQKKIRDIDKLPMLRLGKWVPESQTIDKKGVIHGTEPPRLHVSYHLSRIYAPWDNCSFSHVLVEFMKSQPYPRKLMNFRNSWLAEVWEDVMEELRGEEIRERQGEYEQRTVPEEAYILLATVDVQKDHFWYVLRAWGHNGQSWLVRFGQAPTWEVLWGVLERSVYVSEETGHRIPLEGTLVDCGFRRREVLRECSRSPKRIPIRGSINLKRPITQDKRIQMVTIDTSVFKEQLHRTIRQDDDAPDAWHLPVDMPKEYFDHMTAEQPLLERDKLTGRMKVRWKVIYDGARNDAFDCETYQMVGAEMANVWNRWEGPPARDPRLPRTKGGEKSERKGKKRRFATRRFRTR